MWDFDDSGFDFDTSKPQKPIEWKAFAPPITDRSRLNASKRSKAQRCRSPKRKENADSQEDAPKSARADAKGNELTLGIHNRAGETQMLEAEDDEGNVEYKLKLKQNNPTRFQQLVTQLQFRLSEGNGHCLYYIGIEDDGYVRGLDEADLDTSFETLTAMAGRVNAVVTSQERLPASSGRQYIIAKVSRLCQEELHYKDICVAVAGGEDSGKSTLTAVLSHGQNGTPVLDNGSGSARMSTFKHIHEIESGKTSSLGHHSVAYDEEGRVLNYAGTNAPWSPEEVANEAACVLQLVDLGGSRKFLKTAFYGLTALLPKFLLLCANPMDGFTDVAKQHMAVALALQIPIAVVITKVDKASGAMLEGIDGQLRDFFNAACSLAPSASQGLEVAHISSEAQAHQAAEQLASGHQAISLYVPIFKVNNISGKGLMLLHAFLSRLHVHSSDLLATSPSSQLESCQKLPVEAPKKASEEASEVLFVVDELFDVKGTGQVASGTLVRGSIAVGQKLLLGPTAKANFKPVTIKSIERSQVPVLRIRSGPVATLLFKEDREEASRTASRDCRLSEDFARSSVDSARAERGSVAVPQQAARISISEPPSADSGQPTQFNPQRQNDGNGEAQAALGTTEAELSSMTLREEARRPVGGLSKSLGSAPGSREYNASDQTDRRHDEWQSKGPLCSARFMPVTDLSDRSPVEHVPEAGSESAASLIRVDRLDNKTLSSARPALNGSTEVQGAHGEGQQLEASASDAPSLDTASMANFRKGTVFVALESDPQASWEFEALMVLFSGFWPPRGLLSGSWPFALDSETDFGAGSATGTSPTLHNFADMSAGSFGRSPGRSRSLKRGTRGIYTPMIHCNNVRQASKVVSMLEENLPEHWSAEEALNATGINLMPALSAAMSVSSQSPEVLDPEICIAHVRFRFLHEPAWLEVGSKVVARDRTENCLSGAGLVTKIFSA